MDSTPAEKQQMRAGVDRLAPTTSRSIDTRRRVQDGGLSSPRNRARVRTVARSTTRTVRRKASGAEPISAVVEGVGNVAPGCRTKTGHARRICCRLLADGGSIPPASTTLTDLDDRLRVIECKQHEIWIMLKEILRATLKEKR